MKTFLKSHRLLSFVIALLMVLVGFSPPEDDPRIKRIKERISQLNQKFPQQKVFVHTDRNEYAVNQNIWLKAYVRDAASLKPDTLSTNLYVELVNWQDEVVDTRLLRITNGTAVGDFHLKDSLEDGNYLLRAYTNWMKNFSRFIFTKKISIRNPNPYYFSRFDYQEYKQDQRQKRRKSRRYDVQFFPEGGEYVAGIETLVAFKATNDLGKSVPVKGVILDNKGNEVAQIKSQHAGMGSFDFLPEAGKKYRAKLEIEGKTKRFDLPPVLEKGIVMRVDNSDPSFLNIHVETNRAKSEDTYANDIILVGQSGNKIRHIKKINLPDLELQYQIPKADFPTGIAQITLFDGKTRPRCQRLVFIDHNDALQIEAQTGKTRYSPREKVNLELSVRDKNGNPVAANLSLAVRNAVKVVEEEYPTDIRAWMLLQSDLAGQVEKPGYYFKDRSMKTRQHLDLLMLTQGWRRFTWVRLLTSKLPEPNYRVEDKIEIKGKIVRDILDIPVQESYVELTVLSEYNDVYEYTTGDDGRFSFVGLDYTDTMEVSISALTRRGRKGILILLDENPPPSLKRNFADGVAENISGTRGKQSPRPHYRSKLEDRYDSTYADERIHGVPDNVITREEIESTNATSLLEVLRGRVPGLHVNGNDINIRGINSIYGDTRPLIVVDGMPTDYSAIHSISPNDVERIEILKGPSAAIYGLRGANGVIAIYTRRGYHITRGLKFNMWGFYTAREFYSPNYENPATPTDTTDSRETIYWNPAIKTDANGKANVSFFNSDNCREFNIVVQGMTKDGKIGSLQKK